jgi:DNA primase
MYYQLVSLVDSVLGAHKEFNRTEFYYFCPFCHHYKPKLAVNVNKRKWHCWKCGAAGNTLLSLLRKLHVSREQIAELSSILGEEVYKFKDDKPTEGILILPQEYQPLYVNGNKQAISYLNQRGITESDIIKYQLGYCEKGLYWGRIIIPSFDVSGRLNYFVGRDITNKSKLPYLMPPISKNVVGFESIINWKHHIVLVEGAFDSMAVKINAIPLFGKTLSKRLREKIIKESVNEIYLALDRDALKDTLKIAEKYMKEGLSVYVIELNGKDPSVLGFEQMQLLIKSATLLTFNNLLELKLRLV